MKAGKFTGLSISNFGKKTWILQNKINFTKFGTAQGGTASPVYFKQSW